MKPLRLVPLLLVACGPPVMKGNADLRLRELLSTSHATPEAIIPLLAVEATVHRAEGTVQGAAAAAAALAGVKPEGETRLYRHHDVSLMVLGDGRVLFLQRGGEDRVTRAVELRAPAPSDSLPRQAVYYDRAWNADEAPARDAILRAVWAEKGRYVDPMNDTVSPEGVSKTIGNFRFVFPGSKVKSTSGVADAGEGWMTFDVAHLDPDGKIELIAGFFGTRYAQ